MPNSNKRLTRIVHFLQRTLPLFSLAACLTTPVFAKAVAGTAAKQAEWCKRLTQRLPGVSTATCQKSALTPTGAVSRQGFPILMRQVPAANKNRSDGPIRILLLGGIHGDELTAS